MTSRTGSLPLSASDGSTINNTNTSSASSTSSASTPSYAQQLEPYVKYAYNLMTCEQTQRALYSSVAFSALFIIGVATACVIYVIIYVAYVPQINHVLPIYFQYGHPTEISQPTAVVFLSNPNTADKASILTAGQHYKLVVEMSVPNSEHNNQLGNFMVAADIYSHKKALIASSSRPALLTYQSGIVKTLSTLLKSVPILLGLSSESLTIKTVLIENLIENESKPSLLLVLRLSDSRLQLYEAKLVLDANFVGLPYFMYHWFVTSALFFVSLICMFESIWAFAVWRVAKRLIDQIFPDQQSLSYGTNDGTSRHPPKEPVSGPKDASDTSETSSSWMNKPPPPYPTSSESSSSSRSESSNIQAAPPLPSSATVKNGTNRDDSNDQQETSTSSSNTPNGNNNTSDADRTSNTIVSAAVPAAADVYSPPRRPLRPPSTEVEADIPTKALDMPHQPLDSSSSRVVPDVEEPESDQEDNLPPITPTMSLSPHRSTLLTGGRSSPTMYFVPGLTFSNNSTPMPTPEQETASTVDGSHNGWSLLEGEGGNADESSASEDIFADAESVD